MFRICTYKNTRTLQTAISQSTFTLKTSSSLYSKMKQIQLLMLFLCYLHNSYGLPFEATTISSEMTTAGNMYVLSALEHHEAVPANAIEIQPDEAHKDIPDDHILKKKIIALPLNLVTADTKVLKNDQGHAVVAKATDGSDEEMMQAESSIVFRPLFSYRRQMGERRRLYVPSRSYNYRDQQPARDTNSQNYVPSCNRRKYYSGNNNNNYNNDKSFEDSNSRPARRQYPSYYPSYYENAQFPALI